MYYAIGDIHGRYNKLEKLLKTIKPSSKDKIVFLGDYVDRGPKSRKVVAAVKELVQDGHWAVLGNHDDMFVKWYFHPQNPDYIMWKEHYLKPTLHSYHRGWFDKETLKEHIHFLKGLPKCYTTKTFQFFHSGDVFNPLWGRPYDSDHTDTGHYIVHGHTPAAQVFIGKNRCCLDTGCGWSKGGKLSCGVFEEGTKRPLDIIQV